MGEQWRYKYGFSLYTDIKSALNVLMIYDHASFILQHRGQYR